MTDYIGLLEGRRATSDAVLRQVLAWLKDVRPETSGLFGHDDHGNDVDAWRHGGTAALLAYHHGYDNVKRWGDALEDYHPDNEQEYKQDVRNNEVGAKIGALARITGMTIPELGDAVKAAFKAGAFQTDAYAPFSGGPTFRVGDMTLSAGSGVVILPDGSRFDLTKSAIISDGGLEYPLLHVIRKDGSVQNNWTNMEDSRTLFQSGIGKWELPQSGDAPAPSFNDRFSAIAPSAAAGPLQQDGWLSPTLPRSLTAPSLTSSMFSPTPFTNPSPSFSGNSVPTGGFGNRNPFPTGSPGGAPSPDMRGQRKDRRSAAPDGEAWASAQGATSATPAFQQDAAYSPTGDFFGNFPRASAVAAAPSPLAFNDSGSGTRTATDFDANMPDLSRLMSGVGQFLLNSLITPAEAAPLSAPPSPSLPAPEPGEEAQGAPSNVPERRLSRKILNPSAGVPINTRSPPTQEPQESEGPLTLNEAYLLYLARLNARRAQASMSDPAGPTAPFDASNPNPPRLSAADWIASLAGVDRQNPTQPASSGVLASPIDSSENANYSGGLPGRYLALAGLDLENPNQPAPTDDEQVQANLRELDAKLSSTGDIRDAWALYKARKKASQARGTIYQA
jgi:hypothetical protein